MNIGIEELKELKGALDDALAVSQCAEDSSKDHIKRSLSIVNGNLAMVQLTLAHMLQRMEKSETQAESETAKKAEIIFANELTADFTQTRAWNKIAREDPRIVKEEADFEAVIEGLPKQNEIWDAGMNLICAYTDAAILYGIHIAHVMRDVAKNPAELSEYVLTLKPEAAP